MARCTRACYAQIVLLLALFVGREVAALEKGPWLREPWYFCAGTDLGYSYFTNVNQGYNPERYHSNNVLFDLFAILPFFPLWEGEVEIEFWQTSKRSFGWESLAGQLRYAFWDELSGDPCSFTIGGVIRGLPASRLRDVATPYHNLWNFELTGAVGKEASRGGEWIVHTYLFGAIGQANKGSPWVRALFDLRGKVFSCFELGGFIAGYFGLGRETLVDVNNFQSYARIAHRNLDVGGEVALDFATYGRVSFEYAARVYARSFPANYESFIGRYEFSFSF